MNEELKPLAGIRMPEFKDFWMWVKRTFTPSYRAEIDAYLAEATDIYDLERRMRNLVVRGMV